MQENKLREELGGETLWGLPKNISDELVDAYPLISSRRLSLDSIVLFLGLPLGVILFIICHQISEQNALKLASKIDGFAYSVNLWGSAFIVAMTWLLLSDVIVAFIYIRQPMPKKGAVFLDSIKKAKTNPRKIRIIKSLLEKRENTATATATELINDYLKRHIRIIGLITTPLLLVSVGMTYAALNRLTIISPTGIHTSSPWSKDIKVQKWESAFTFSPVCKYTPRKQTGKSGTPERHKFTYVIRWNNGSLFTLPTTLQLNGKKWLDNFETIDATLVSKGAKFRRLTSGKSDPLHPKCLKHYRDKLGPELTPRFDSLLRVNEVD